MDFYDICEALGVGLAAGTIAGAFFGDRGNPRAINLSGVLAGAAVGLILAAAGGDSIVAGVIAGGLAGLAGSAVVAGIVAGAARRGAGGVGGLVFIVALAALVLAAVSILLPPVALVAFVAVLALGFSRRRRAERKYEGLRILK
jgi:hypothetical protein